MSASRSHSPIRILPALALAATFCLAGCLTPAPEEPDSGPAIRSGAAYGGLNPAEIDSVRTEVAQRWGVSRDAVFVLPEFLGVSDVHIPWSNFRKAPPGALPRSVAPLAKVSQRRLEHNCSWYEPWCSEHGPVGLGRVSNIRLYTSVAGLKPLVDNAIKQWNASGSLIYFSRVESGSYDTHVRESSSTGSPSEWVARTLMPEEGKPSLKVEIRNGTNTDYDWPRRTQSENIAALTHEFGHVVGLEHTGLNQQWDMHITGTPEQDAASVMNPTAPIPTKPSYWDEIAMRIMFPMNLQQELSQLGDVNGDGRKDIIVIADNGVSVSFQNPVTGRYDDIAMVHYQFAKGQGWTSNHPKLFGDFNGDGKTDIVGFGQSQTIVSVASGNGFTSSVWSTNFTYNAGWRTNTTPRMVGDFNGDGKDDIAGFANDGVIVGISTGTGFTTTFWLAGNMGYNQGWRVESHPRMVGDFNGDGFDDIIGFSNSGAIVGVSNRTSAFTASYWLNDMGVNQGWTVAENPRVVGNFDGLGGDDILGFANGGCIVVKSTGSSFTAPAFWLNDLGYNQGYRSATHLRTVGDLTGDGKDDVIAFANGATIVGRSTGTAFASAIWANNFGYNQGWRVVQTPRLIGDIDNNGKEDVVGLGFTDYILGKSTGTALSTSVGYTYKTY